MATKNWKFESLRIAVLYVLKEEGPHTCQQLHERIGASRPHIGTVLRILLYGGHVTHQGYPRSYIFNNVRAFKDRANDPFDIAQEQAT